MSSVLLPVFVSPFGSPSAAVYAAVSPSLLVACDPRLALGVWDACIAKFCVVDVASHAVDSAFGRTPTFQRRPGNLCLQPARKRVRVVACRRR